MIVNINWYKTQVSKEELEIYLSIYPEYRETYYIISE